MLSQCTRIFTLMAVLLILAPSSDAKPVVIRGNAYGLWSPTHPHLTSGNTKPNSPVLYVPLPPIAEPVEVAEVPDVCPTIQSAPHLCQTL